MIVRALIVAIFALICATPASAQTAGRRAAVVAELFTSQGCVQCPRANRFLGSVSRGEGVLALTFPVDIWDYLGWYDTLAHPDFTRRQTDYSEALRERKRTPQLILNGRRTVATGDWDDARFAIEQERAAAQASSNVHLALTRFRNGRLRIELNGPHRETPADVWFLTYSSNPVVVHVTTGPNEDRSVIHYNLVTRIDRAGVWSGGASVLERPVCNANCAVIVQEPSGGPILAAAYLSRR